MEIGLSGATISSVSGLQRVIAPFNLKEGMACVISVNHKWRTHSRLFRLMLERVSPNLANIETADGGPAAPMRLSNWHRFIPYWSGVGQKLVWGASRRVLGRSLWDKGNPGTDGLAYPQGQWRRDTVALLEDGVLDPAHMVSASLYDAEQLRTLLSQAQADEFKFEPVLSRILTVEMALRQVNTAIG